ncbi:hypothetical protein [Streptomyces sp. YIM 98790]|uniref:hypothetical protein n=1 Tax=Streptomyces sp. YIM 98790 TaxID=2689077 RepID=UPI00140A96D6|nr:hypothetical protein [Streptomyces sp. YIM 98790]
MGSLGALTAHVLLPFLAHAGWYVVAAATLVVVITCEISSRRRTNWLVAVATLALAAVVLRME